MKCRAYNTSPFLTFYSYMGPNFSKHLLNFDIQIEILYLTHMAQIIQANTKIIMYVTSIKIKTIIVINSYLDWNNIILYSLLFTVQGKTIIRCLSREWMISFPRIVM